MIYAAHPDVEYVGICDIDPVKVADVRDRFGLTRTHADVAEVIASDEYDAVHLVTPIPNHAGLSVEVLDSGKHCACAVPMGVSLEELRAVVAAEERSGKNYMMMETAVYTREHFFVREMIEKGEMGEIQFLRGAHYQDMEGWPAYWQGLPPMHYATHAVAPLLSLTQARATKVHCFGSGLLREQFRGNYDNPYPVETAIFQLDKNHLSAEVTRSLFQTARGALEGFTVYGEKATFELNIEPVVFRIGGYDAALRRNKVTLERPALPSYGHLLPKEIAPFGERHTVPDPNDPGKTIVQGGGHGGSHPHMVNEFVRSIMEGRKSQIDAVTAANWTAAGVCAHASAMREERVSSSRRLSARPAWGAAATIGRPARVRPGVRQ
jgi:predicted dehydrogenase